MCFPTNNMGQIATGIVGAGLQGDSGVSFSGDRAQATKFVQNNDPGFTDPQAPAAGRAPPPPPAPGAPVAGATLYTPRPLQSLTIPQTSGGAPSSNSLGGMSGASGLNIPQA